MLESRLEGVHCIIACRFHEAMKHFALTTPLRGLSTPAAPPPSFSSLPSPPHSLLDYPPLAALTNVLIQAFNDLRQCAPLAGGPEIAQELKRLLQSTVHDVVEYHRLMDSRMFSRLIAWGRYKEFNFVPKCQGVFFGLKCRGAMGRAWEQGLLQVVKLRLCNFKMSSQFF